MLARASSWRLPRPGACLVLARASSSAQQTWSWPYRGFPEPPEPSNISIMSLSGDVPISPSPSVPAIFVARSPFAATMILGVHEDEEAVAELLHLGHRVLLEHRLDSEALRLDDPSLVRRLRGSVRDPPQDLFLGLRAGTQARFALEVDRLAFDLVHDRVDACLVRQGSGVAAQRPPVDDERDLHDLRVGGASVVLDPELHDGVAPIVEQPLQPFEAPFGVAARAFGNFEVLPLDDGPHG